ncbi:MAG TPA: peptidase M20 [Gammaproteobacteria bacterium]|nr:peptidase M20 [Gammaproteobacteria bacterium]
MDKSAAHIHRSWQGEVREALADFIRLPAKSPAFDPAWQANAYLEEAATRFLEWALAQPVTGMRAELLTSEGRTPLLFIEVAATSGDAGAGTVLLYGHLDKQPELFGWETGLGPWSPVLAADRLYGRGGGDDGYALFSALTAIAALQAAGRPHGRCLLLIEASEESGSHDLPHYIELLGARIGSPELVLCLDSWCGNYDQLWCTTSLRGLVGGTLEVEVLTEGVHSGDAGGVVPSPLRLLRQLLDRVEDAASGEVRLEACRVSIPAERIAEAAAAAAALGATVHARFPFAGGTRPDRLDGAELVLNRSWRPAFTLTGAEGLPPIADAGNVLLPRISVKVSLRLPPTCDPLRAKAELEQRLTEDPPCGATIRFRADWAAAGWHAPPLSHWLRQSLEQSSRTRFGRSVMFQGEGGTIPFMAMLAQRFPKAEFVVTGVLGPQSNAHGPNEFLHLPTAERLTQCVADLIADHAVAHTG